MNTAPLLLTTKFDPSAATGTLPVRRFGRNWAGGLQSVRRFVTDRVLAPMLAAIRSGIRGTALGILTPLALADAIWTRLVATPTANGLARARAGWLHRWSRAARVVLGVRTVIDGHLPVSGMIVARNSALLDALVLADIHPCVFVAGAELRRRPLLGLLARLGGTIFVESQRGLDLQLATFAIQRALLRRQIVVIFPECNRLRGFSTVLFQPAAELGCTLTASTIGYHAAPESAHPAPPVSPRFAHLLARPFTRAAVAFDSPRFHHGDRKLLAGQLRLEIVTLAAVSQAEQQGLPAACN